MINRHLDSATGGSGESAQLISRLLSALPAASYEMETFSRLADIVATRDIPTASVECKHRPRLLINPDFVSANCQRDEHLFLLVMHELLHVMLAHTSLFPRMTPAQNIAFDVIINARLMHQFSTPEYMGFFDRMNPPDKFPHLLLRPPVGWPHDPTYPDVGPAGTQRILRQLYPPAGIRGRMPFYQEVLSLIRQDMRERGLLLDGMPMLIGDHSDQNVDPDYSDVYLKDILGRMTRKLPMQGIMPGPPGRGGVLGNKQADVYRTSFETRRVFARVLRRCIGANPGTYHKRMRTYIPDISGMNVIPNARDRLSSARRQLGIPNTLWTQPGEVKARVKQYQKRAHVYLDVSGSMSKVVPYLLNLILPYVASGKAETYQFSTVVQHLPLSNLRQGLVRTTGGTQIDCVLQHLLRANPHVPRAVIITDGYTGLPSPDLVAAVTKQGVKIQVILPAESPYEYDLQEIAHDFTVLPPLA